MTADVIPLLPSAESPRIRTRLKNGDFKSFTLSPCANNNHSCYGSFFEKSKPNLDESIEEHLDLKQSWHDVSSHDNIHTDNKVNTLSDWDIVSKPLLLSESQRHRETLQNNESVLNEEGLLVSEPLSLPPSCTTLAVYRPNPIQGFLNSPRLASQTSWKGLYNLGNTCYLNASLQSLLSLEGFVQMILSSNSEKPEGTTKRVLLNELAQIFLRLRGDDVTDDDWALITDHSNPDSVDPTKFKEAIDVQTPLFVGYEQHDSHEFITTLLDLLHDELKYTEKSQTIQPIESPLDNPTDALCDESTNYVIVQDSEHIEESENSPKKARLFSDSRPNGLSASLEQNTAHSITKEPCIQRAVSLSALNMEDIEELLTNPDSLSIPSRLEALDTPEPVSSWKPLWKQRSNHGYLFGGRSSFTSLAHASNRKTGYKTIDPSWHDIESDLLQEQPNDIMNYNNQSANIDDASSISPLHIKEQELNKDTSLVDSYFTMEIRNHLECNSCKFTRSHIETFRCLSLELVDGESSSFSGLKYNQNQTLQESLRKFFASEKRDIKCEKCFFDSATRTMEIVQLPKALLLHIKRFVVDISPDYMSISYNKNHAHVEFSKRLSLNPIDSEGVLAEYLASDARIAQDASRIMCRPQGTPTYCLRSIINHLGSSAEYGHYTATVNRCHSRDPVTQSRSWFDCNDNYVTAIKEAEAFETSSQASAYLLLYELEENLIDNLR